MNRRIRKKKTMYYYIWNILKEKLEEVTGRSDPLNLFLVTLTQGSRKSRIKLEKARTKNQLRKNEKYKLKILNKKVTGYGMKAWI